ncbi:MAG: hypothetical protein HYX47_22425 [Burkholderiales bacterium]|nr:hypothetical protein [Burkholderiales bacterium]
MAASAQPGLPAVIGAELSRPVAAMQRVLQEFATTRSLSRAHIATLNAAVKWAHRIAVHSQQISRLAGGRLRQSHERLFVDALLNDYLDGSRAHFQEAGLQVHRNVRPVEVIVDPGLLSSLLEVAVEWAAEQGRTLQITLDVKNWPEHGALVIKASQQVTTHEAQGEPLDPDTLNWHLLLQLAQVMGLVVDRVIASDHSLVMIEFPRTVKRLEGLTAIEVDSGDDSSMHHSESRPLAGHRLLLVTADERLRREIKDICDLMGLVLDATPTTQQAIRFCELDKPHMIVVDEKLRDARFDELRDDLLRADVNFPMIEIASASNTFEMASWMSNSMSRISRDSLKAQLPSILVMELAKVS